MKKISVKDLDANKVLPILSVLKNKKNICIPETGYIGIFDYSEDFTNDFISLYKETWGTDIILKDDVFSEVLCKKAKKRLKY